MSELTAAVDDEIIAHFKNVLAPYVLENQTFCESLSLGTAKSTAITSGTMLHKVEDSLTKVVEGMTENEASNLSTYQRVCCVQSNHSNSLNFAATNTC